MIKRKIEDDILFGLTFQPAVAVLGPRQVGKTTLVKRLMRILKKESIYFDLENSSDLARFQYDRRAFLDVHKEKTVILDEIHRLPEIFPDLRGMIDEYRVPGRFIILGSASFNLLKNTSESLTGRIAYFELAPLKLREISPNRYLHHWLFGGFPDAFLAKRVEIQQKWFEDFIRSYLEKDLPQYGLFAEPVQLRRLLQMIASIQGNLLNQSMLANSLGIKINKVSTWLDYFEQSFIIRRLKPYYTNIGKRITKTPKIYIRDSGMVHHLLSIFNYDSLMGHIVAGGSWEGYVIEQILSELSYNQLPFFYRTADGSELDLIIEEDLKIRLAIEIKITNSPNLSRGNTIALEDLGNPPLLIITPSAEDYPFREGVQVCNIKTMDRYLRSHLNRS